MPAFDFSYGSGKVVVELPDKNVLGVIDDKQAGKADPPTVSVRDLAQQAMLAPVGGARLRQILAAKHPGHVVIIVSDISRNIKSYETILDVLAGEVVESGVDEKSIEFVVALGTHRLHTGEEQRELYGALIDKFRFTFHDCRQNLWSVGKTSTGLEVLVNERVAKADVKIITGKISYHYMAGFSGGRKSIVPGVAGYDTIRANHAKLLRPGVEIGNLENNIINAEMAQAADLVGVDYCLNVIENSRKTLWLKAGFPAAVFQSGAEYYRKHFAFPVRERADCILTSAGCDDRDLFCAHKILNLARGFVKPGGSIVLFAEAARGIGNRQFADYLGRHNPDELLRFPEEKIEVGGHRAFVTARILRDHKVYVISSLNQEILKSLSFCPAGDAALVLNKIRKHHGNGFRAYLNPAGLRLRADLAEN